MAFSPNAETSERGFRCKVINGRSSKNALFEGLLINLAECADEFRHS